MVRAKFRVTEVQKNGDNYNVSLWPVVGGSAENDSFFRWTPAGSINLNTVNEAAGEQFVVGAEFYVDFTPASKD